MPARLVVLASGAGTTLQAILEAPDLAELVVAAGTDRPGCAAMQRAQAAGKATFAIPLVRDRDIWDDAMAETIASHRPDLVVCAGFMRILGAPVLRRFRLINTHPSLLPAFPGAHAVNDALQYGVKIAGATVHWVDEGIDSGVIIAQAAVPVEDGDTVETLRARIQAAEKPLYVDTIRRIVQGDLS
ncbi:MAG: phosphoribosylglycinamide formyltransferase [Actinomycetota bacterium]